MLILNIKESALSKLSATEHSVKLSARPFSSRNENFSTNLTNWESYRRYPEQADKR